MGDMLRHWRRRSVDDIDGQRLTSLLLCLARIFIIFQHLLLLVTPAERPSGTYRGTSTSLVFTALRAVEILFVRPLVRLSICPSHLRIVLKELNL